MGSDKTEIWYVMKNPQRGLGEEFLPKSKTPFGNTRTIGVLTLGSYV